MKGNILKGKLLNIIFFFVVVFIVVSISVFEIVFRFFDSDSVIECLKYLSFFKITPSFDSLFVALIVLSFVFSVFFCFVVSLFKRRGCK